MVASPTSSPGSPAPAGGAQDGEAGGLRASDSDRDEAAGELGEHFAAGRLSHETFVHRMNAVMGARRRADLPPLLADLPPRERPRSRLAARWSAVRGEAGVVARSVLDGLGLTTGFPAAPPSPRAPRPLPFPRGAGTSFTIGRDSGCDLALGDPTVSRLHAVLERAGGGWLLSDRGSTNGTRVNGWRVRDAVPVRAGDVVRFGEAEYTLVPSEQQRLPS